MHLAYTRGPLNPLVTQVDDWGLIRVCRRDTHKIFNEEKGKEKENKRSNTQKEKDKDKEELKHTSVQNGQLYTFDQPITLTT